MANGTIAAEVYEKATPMTEVRFPFVCGAMAVWAAVLIACAGTVSADEAADSPGTVRASKHPAPDPKEKPDGSFNIPLDTTGGKQFWTDFVVRGGWRIQRNEVTGHYRLLDEKNIRQGWGNYAFCLRELDRRKPADPQAADRGPGRSEAVALTPEAFSRENRRLVRIFVDQVGVLMPAPCPLDRPPTASRIRIPPASRRAIAQTYAPWKFSNASGMG